MDAPPQQTAKDQRAIQARERAGRLRRRDLRARHVPQLADDRVRGVLPCKRPQKGAPILRDRVRAYSVRQGADVVRG